MSSISSTRLLAFLSVVLAPQSFLSGMQFVTATDPANHESRPWTPADSYLGDQIQGAPPAGNLAAHDNHVDVVVVGGGYSGLVSAYELQKAGLETVVLEAKNQIGGRSRSIKRQSGDGIIELGATWINNVTQPAVYALTEEFGLDTAEQYLEGDPVFQSPDGQVTRLTPDTPEDPEVAELENAFGDLINEATEQTDLRRWDNFPEEQDVIFAEWVALKGLWEYPVIQAASVRLTTTIVGREPQDVGAQYFFDYLKAGGGLMPLSLDDKYGAQFLKIKQGTTAIPFSIAAALTPGSVLINTPATSITQHKDHTLVETASGRKFKTKKVILANPTNTYADIKFTPALPCKKSKVVSSTLPGVYAKVIVNYNEPWWRDAGLIGKFTSLVGPICFSWDTSDLSLSQYSLAFFVSGNIARDWHALPDDAARRESMIEHLAILVGEDLADKARDVLEFNVAEWTKEDFLFGGPTSVMVPGMLRQFGTAFRQPFGSLHFGGGETAFEWKGYLEGAVTAGQRAADEVIEALDAGCRE